MIRRWFKILLITFATLVVIAAGLWYYLFHMHGLEDFAASKLNKMLATTVPIEVSIGKIDGNLLSELVLNDVSLRFHSPRAEYQFFGARSISLAYSLKGVWTGNYALKYLILDGAVV
ncbi:MAG: hypothetical protein WAU88_08915, partial [Candidatus Zixiibacteriota bacterium]